MEPDRVEDLFDKYGYVDFLSDPDLLAKHQTMNLKLATRDA
jgi:hypothetical protein